MYPKEIPSDFIRMYPNIREILTYSIEQGIGDGIAYTKHHEDENILATAIENHIWLYIDQFFTFTEKLEDIIW